MNYITIFAWVTAASFLSCSEKREEILAVADYETVSELASPPAITIARAPGVADRKLIRRATLNFEVYNMRQAYDSLKLLTSAAQGYVEDEAHNETDTRRIQNMKMRVPEARFDTFLADVEAISQKLVSRDITTQDVTDEVEDLAVRLRTKKALENQYNEILRQAKTVKDMLAIEEQLGIVREEIESMEARKRSMDQQTTYSVIDLTMFQVTAPEPGYGDRLVFALTEGWLHLTGMIFAIIAYWHVLIMLIPLALGVRVLYGRITRQPARAD